MAALGLCGFLSGCGQPERPAVTPSSTAAPTPSVGHSDPIPDSPGGPPLPPANALTDVMARLADPAVPGDQKITLIEQGTPDEAAGLDRFAIALRDNAALPLTFEARDLAWSQAVPGNVVTTMVIKQAKPQGSEFRYPMEFAPSDGSWQLTRQTADLLLELDTAAPTPPR
ncbi:hypothetical protein [Mycolicibacterium iranicum]|uniref:Low molecular weight antigen MTB12-like C-terminal domain-containing protein n=1 Tax=Mycolicibacterium iranicum TaxID=912594 RepID=A0ABT4HD83_MYCIR|nr:hypothetical protein [Mycolicibacterium iranicum]MCZ0728158.1 hypothetical protein [Mycolicibacterium iranicum]